MQSATRKRIIVTGLCTVAALLVAYVMTLQIMAPKLRSMAREEMRTYLAARFKSAVAFDEFDVTFFPGVRAVVYGLVLRHGGRTDIPPLIRVQRVALHATLRGLLSGRPEISSVKLDGLQIHMPPRGLGGPPLIHPTDQNLARKYPIVIDEKAKLSQTMTGWKSVMLEAVQFLL